MTKWKNVSLLSMYRSLFILIFVFCVTLPALAQKIYQEQLKKIEVQGEASSQVNADIFEITILCKSYSKADTLKDSTRLVERKKTVSLQAVNTWVLSFVSKYEQDVRCLYADVASERYDATSGVRYHVPNRTDIATYKIRFNGIEALNSFFKSFPRESLYELTVENCSYSKEPDLYASLKIKAISNAKEKASKLLTAAGERLSGLVEATEEHEKRNSLSPKYVFHSSYFVVSELVMLLSSCKLDYFSKAKVVFEIE